MEDAAQMMWAVQKLQQTFRWCGRRKGTIIRVRRRRKTVHKSMLVGEMGFGIKWLVGNWRR